MTNFTDIDDAVEAVRSFLRASDVSLLPTQRRDRRNNDPGFAT